MSKEAMKLALEHIRQSKIQGSAIDRNEMLDEASKALEEALAKQEQGEPVAWMNSKRDMTYIHGPYNADDIPLYTTLQQRKPLTDKQDAKRWQFLRNASSDVTLRLHNSRNDCRDSVIDAAIEAAHGIKE